MKNVLVGSPAVLVRDDIHCNEYPGTRRVMNVGYPGSKMSTRFNPTTLHISDDAFSTISIEFHTVVPIRVVDIS